MDPEVDFDNKLKDMLMNIVKEWKANPTPVITVYTDGSLQRYL